MATLEELFAPISKDEMLASILDIAAAVGMPTTSWQPGEADREVLEVTAQKMADLTNVTAAIAAGGLLDFAVLLTDPKWITLLAKSMFGVDRILATFGSGVVTLNNTSGVTYTPVAGDLHFVNSTTGATYTNTTGGTLPAMGMLSVDIVADAAGTESNAASGQIDALVTPLLGVTVTNANPVAGTDNETPENLATRCRAKLAAASPNGPAAAYDYFARTAVRASDGSNVGVTRTLVVQSNGSNTVYVATASGGVPGVFNDPTTDLGAVNLNIQSKCVPTGISASVASAVVNTITVSGTVYLKHGSSANATDVQSAIVAKLIEYFSTIPIGGFDVGAGGFVFLDALIGQVFQAHPDIIQFVPSAPPGDVALSQSDVAVTDSVGGDFTILIA